MSTQAQPGCYQKCVQGRYRSYMTTKNEFKKVSLLLENLHLRNKSRLRYFKRNPPKSNMCICQNCGWNGPKDTFLTSYYLYKCPECRSGAPFIKDFDLR